MNSTTFLQRLFQDSSFVDKRVVCFSGESQPLLFLSLLGSWFSRSGRMVRSLHVKEEAMQARAELQTSFLGVSSVYLLRGMGDLSSSELKDWLLFLRAYSGPHTLFLHLPSYEKLLNDPLLVVSLPSVVDAPLFDAIWTLSPLVVRKRPIDSAIFMRNLQIDDACMLIYYVTFAGKNAQQFMSERLDTIIEPTASLFSFSGHFFAQKTAAFFREWLWLKAIYPEQFWLSFWSEQLFRAASYVQFIKDKKLDEAKRVSYKLPFSFIKYDWKKHSVSSLRAAHDDLYKMDYRIKNGSVMPALDLFYIRFFNRIKEPVRLDNTTRNDHSHRLLSR